MAANADVHAVLQTCGIGDVAVRNIIIATEGFDTLEALGILESDTDVTEMAKRMSSRTAADGRAILGTVTIKRLQALIWWIRDRQKRQLTLDSALFTAAAMSEAMRLKEIQKDRPEPDVSVTTLSKFDPDDFDTHEDAFINAMAQTYGVLKEPLRYIIRPRVDPGVYSNTAEERSFQLRLTGAAYEQDNNAVYHKLKTFLIDTAGWAWIESFDSMEDGRSAFLAWSDHYNGPGELSKRTALAKAKLGSLHYKNERSMSFERYIELLTKCYNTLEKDPDQRLSPRQKVETLLRGIATQDTELQGAKSVIDQSYPRDFSQACAYFSQQVARVHGPAQLKYRQQRGKRRYISAFQRGGGREGGRGRGRGRFSGFSGRFGRGRSGRFGRGGHGRGGGGQSDRIVMNGIDFSNPFRSFTDDEWERLGPNGGRAYVTQRRLAQQGRGQPGQGTDHSGRGAGGRGGQRNAAALQIPGQPEVEQLQADVSHSSERGAQNGRGFGRGAYGPTPGRGPT